MPNQARGARENPLQSNPPPRIPRSAFDRSYSHKTTFESGYLIPIHVDEILPGDTVNLQPSFLCRLATPLTPYMDGLYFDWQMFFVPTRQVWTNFVKQQGERTDPDDHNDYTTPQMTSPTNGHLAQSLSDYMTIPIQDDITHSSLFHRAYNHVWNTWFRDADLQDSAVVDMDDGPDDTTDYVLLRRGKRKDYISGARPFAQRGDAVELPLGTTAPVIGTITGDGTPTFDVGGDLNNALTHALDNGVDHLEALGVTNTGPAIWNTPNLDATGLSVDLSTATAATINTIRQALATQHVLERDARGGGRYWEVVGSHFGIFPDHIRLQRPELLGTGSMNIGVNPVSGTADTGAGVGALGAFALASSVGRGFVKSFDEHGMILIVASVRADLTWQRGLHKMFTRMTRYDHYLPDFAHIGEQAVLSQELWYNDEGDPDLGTGDYSVWGYQPRYEEYRHRHSVITGEFRSDFAASLDIWHLAIDYTTRPVLNAAFIEENPPVERVVTLGVDEPQLLLDCYFKIKHVRPMPRFGTPGLTRF